MSDNNCQKSFYIPAIGDVTQDQIALAFWKHKIGEIERVDYFQNASGNWCAFVHFSILYNNYGVLSILDEINRYGSYKFWINPFEYLILRNMTCEKIPETHMNIHQIAAKLEEKDDHIELLQFMSNCDGQKIAELEQRISDLEKIISKLNLESHRNRWEDEEMEKMVTSLVGPRWTEEDDVDAMSPIFVGFNESKVDHEHDYENENEDNISILSNEMR
jgi:hypothetical protein